MGLPKPPKIETVVQQPLAKAPDEAEVIDPSDIVLGSEDEGLDSETLLGKRALSRPLGVSGVGGV